MKYAPVGRNFLILGSFPKYAAEDAIRPGALEVYMLVMAFSGNVITEVDTEGLTDIVIGESLEQSITQILFLEKLVAQVTTVEDILGVVLLAPITAAREEESEEIMPPAPTEADPEEYVESEEVLDVTPEYGRTAARPPPEREAATSGTGGSTAESITPPKGECDKDGAPSPATLAAGENSNIAWTSTVPSGYQRDRPNALAKAHEGGESHPSKPVQNTGMASDSSGPG